jgi:hypothetical protein
MEKQKLDLTTIKIDELINFTSAMIQFDNVDLIKSANDVTAKYQNLVVTEEIIPSIKKEVAGLNKLVTQMEDQRKSIKRTYNEPYNAFEGKIKEVTTIINSTVNELKKQLDVFEQKRKQEKMEIVSKLIASAVFESGLIHKFATQIIVHDKFLNTSESLPQIKIAIDDQVKHLLEAQNNELEAERLRLEVEEMKQSEWQRKQAEQQAITVARMELLNHLKNKYNTMDVTYSETKHLTDIQLHELFDNIKTEQESKIEVEKLKQSQVIESVFDDIQIVVETGTDITESLIEQKRYLLELSGINDSEYLEILEALKNAYPHIIIRKG